MAHGQGEYELKMSSLGKKAGKVVAGAVKEGLQTVASDSESEGQPGLPSWRKILKKVIKKFLEKTVGVWTFPCVNSFFWAIFLGVVFLLCAIPFLVVGFLSECQALLKLCVVQGVSLLIVAVVCLLYLGGHYRKSAFCINSLNSIIVLGVTGCLASTVPFILILVNVELGKVNPLSVGIPGTADLYCIYSPKAEFAAVLSVVISLVLLFIFTLTYGGTGCYLKITGKTSSDRHYCCPKLKNCPGNGFGEEEVQEDND